MESDKWLFTTPFIIIVMGIIILYGLFKINIKINDWRLTSLCIIPASLILLYGWILLFSPLIENARLANRLVLISNMSVSIHVIAAYIKQYNKGGKQIWHFPKSKFK